MFEKMKGMTFKEKVEYYCQYYGIATIVIIVAICFAIYIANTIVKNNKVKPAATILVINAENTTCSEEYEEWLTQILISHDYDTERYSIDTHADITIGGESTDVAAYNSLVKLQSYLMSDRCDVMICNEGYWEDFVAEGACADLADYLPEDVILAHADDLLYQVDSQTGEEYIAGIYTDAGSELMQMGGWYSEEASIITIGFGTDNEIAVELVLSALGD